MHIIDLRSDTATRPSEAMRRFMAFAPVGDEQIKEDPTVNRLQEATAELLGKEAALFLPSTTMANQIAFKVLTNPGEEILIEATAHPVHFEAGGLAFHSGLMVRLLQGVRGIFQPGQVEAAIRPDNPHHCRTTCLSIENTHNMGGGTIWPLDLLNAVCQVGRKHGLKLHLDGSRLLNASVATGIPAKAYAEPFDAVALCFSKGLGAPVGSCLAGSREFIEEARRYKHLFGGAMRQAGIIAAGALYALQHNIDRLAEDHANARKLAQGLASIPGIDIDPSEVQTNLVFFNIGNTGLTPIELSTRLREEHGVLILPTLGPGRMRAVTHLDVSAEDIDIALHAIKKVVAS
jgi:threonine aldolase